LKELIITLRQNLIVKQVVSSSGGKNGK
jgi:hypothetical protein